MDSVLTLMSMVISMKATSKMVRSTVKDNLLSQSSLIAKLRSPTAVTGMRISSMVMAMKYTRMVMNTMENSVKISNTVRASYSIGLADTTMVSGSKELNTELEL